jgi:very-short-patch-repair endonuclease
MIYDEGRTAELEEKGFKLLRFRNDEVLNDIKRALEKISDVLTTKY